MIITINPFTEETIKEYLPISQSEIDLQLNNSDLAFKKWKNTKLIYRIDLIKNLEKAIITNKQKLAELMTKEMGKPISQGFAEIDKCAYLCNYYAENAEQFLSDIKYNVPNTNSYVSIQPLGVILAVMPWNFPLWQVFRFAVPALLAGNTGLLKHSNNSMGTAIEIQNLFQEAGFPENVFVNLLIDVDPVVEIIKHNAIKAVTFTGSTKIGKLIAQTAGSALKKSVLELGGSDPYIVLKDADLVNAAKACATSRMINNGQSCIAAKRFIIDNAVFDEFLQLFIKELAAYEYADPMLESTKYGPIARKDLLLNLEDQLIRGTANGAEIIEFDENHNLLGYYFKKRIAIVKEMDNPLFKEETFGPISTIYTFKNEEEAIIAANSTEFGLGAAIFSNDIEKAKYLGEKMVDSGSVFVNDFVKSNPILPFGGIKNSGYGRELSDFGIREFVNIKTMSIKI